MSPARTVSNRLLACVGDVNSVATFSGIPFYFLREAKELDLLDVGLPLETSSPAWAIRRYAWNAWNASKGRGIGGFQYSDSFLEALWRPFRASVQDSAVISCFQLFPDSVVEDDSITKWFFLDQTLTGLFRFYKVGESLSEYTVRNALAREKAGYEAAEGIVMQSRWAADEVTALYGIDKSKVHVVVAGASISEGDFRRWDASAAPRKRDSSRPLSLVFVGKEWKRKGLDRLLLALEIAHSRGSSASLRVIGCSPDSLPMALRQIQGVEWVGFVDKQRDMGRFIELVASCDVGCLLSRAEAGGISLREFLVFGMPAIAPDCGGAVDHAHRGASVFASPDARPEEIADLIRRLDQDIDFYDELAATAWRERSTGLWSSSVRRFAEVWPYRPVPDLNARTN